MKLKTIIACMTVLFLSSVITLMGQTKVSGTDHCNPPDPNYSVNVGDRTTHTIQLMQNKCEWIKPMAVEGIESKGGLDTGVADVSGNRVRVHGYHVSTMANGDKCIIRYEKSVMMKEGKPGISEGGWSFEGGTGVCKGIKGKGTFKTTTEADGSRTADVVGEYTLPAKK